MNTFKEGDLVYFPEKYRQVLKVCKNSPNAYDKETYPLNVAGYAITIDGKLKTSKTASIYLATQENKEKLEAFYGIKLNPALVIKLTSKNIIETMLARGHKDIPCWVSINIEQPDSTCLWVFVRSINSKNEFVDKDNMSWPYATPFNTKTREAITELSE